MSRKQLDLTLARLTPEQRCSMLALVEQDRRERRKLYRYAVAVGCSLVLWVVVVSAIVLGLTNGSQP